MRVMHKLSILIIAFLHASVCIGSTIDVSELKREVGIARNEIFARHGRPFTSPVYRDYFNQTDWYEENPNYSDSLLSPAEKRDAAILLRYERELPALNSWEIDYLHKVFLTYMNFRSKGPETTLEKKGDLTGDGGLDTLRSHVHVVGDDVLVDSEVISRGEVIWSERRKNPYLYLGDSEMLMSESDIWVRFHTAITSDLPTIIGKSEQDDYLVKISVEKINQLGYAITEYEYRIYEKGFVGELLLHGEPECCRESMIWFSPAKSFVTFYSP